MPLADHIAWYLDSASFGGVLSERILAALPLADGLYCGLVFSFDSPGAPRIQFWERIDDLERQGFAPLTAARARAICDALPRFLERLDETMGDRRSALGEARAYPNAQRPTSSAGPGVSLC